MNRESMAVGMMRRLVWLLVVGALSWPQAAIAQSVILREFGELTNADYFVPEAFDDEGVGFEDLVPERFDGDIAEAQVFDSYTFLGKRGQRVSITSQSISFDTVLALGTLAANKQEIELLSASNDSAEQRFNPGAQIVMTLPADAEYTVLVSSDRAAARGSYVLSITDMNGTVGSSEATVQPNAQCAIVRCPY